VGRCREAGDVQARIDEFTARLREVSEAISDLQVTRKTLLSLAAPDDAQPATEPADPARRYLSTRPTSRSSPRSPTSSGPCGPATSA
jgi:hypothetical protein